MTTFHPHESLHVPIPVAAIAPHLLHSPAHSPEFEFQNNMDSYREQPADSPQPLVYPPSPALNSTGFASAEQITPQTPPAATSPSGMLVVHSYGPACAPPGAPLTALVDFTNLSGANVRLRIVFGDLALPTSVTPSATPNDRTRGPTRGQWTLKVVIPPAGQGVAHMANVGMTDGRLQWPLTLQALDASGNLLDTITFGYFSYDNYSMSSQSASPNSHYEYRNRSRSPGKRSREDDIDYSPFTSYIKRPAIDTEPLNLRRMSIMSDSNAYIGSTQVSDTDRSYFQPSTSAPTPSHYPGASVSPQAFHHQVPTQSSFQTRSPRRSDLYPDPSHTSLHFDDAPALIRTSQLGHDAKSEQANITLQDDLENMKRNWTETESKSGRRLVQFWKRQVGTTLQISFAPVPQSAYKENTIVVSCIYRENIDDYFITSVDVIYLLEALAGSRFEVEEKNRIRRNLEGFKPLTISKSKPGTEEFFRVIMEFPPPRPRNIEKDVKVFEWGKLKMMLEKVFSKYSTVSSSISLPMKQDVHHGFPKMMYTYPKVSNRIPSDPTRAYVGSDIRPKMEEHPISFHQPTSPTTLTHPTHGESSYADNLLSSRYNEYAESYPDQLAANGYYNGMHVYDMPRVDFDQSMMKGDEQAMHATSQTNLGRHDNFRSDSPALSDNSPLSMTLSISSGGSSDGQGAPIDNSNTSSFTSL